MVRHRSFIWRRNNGNRLLLARHDTKLRITLAKTCTMKMTITTSATFEPRESKVWHIWRMWHHGGHDDSHVQLCPQRHDVCHKVGPVPDEVVAHLLELVLSITQGINSVWGGRVETMDVVSRIVSAILRPPHHGDASKSDRVDNTFISANEPEAGIVLTRRTSGTHPRRTPGHMADSTGRLFLLVSPMHRCGSYITPD